MTLENTLEELSRQKDLVILVTDTAQLAKLKHLPNVIQCGASEHALSVAAGIALEGKMPIIITKTALQDKFIIDNNLNVKVISLGGELPLEGTIIIPADSNETHKAIMASSIHKGPVWIQANKETGKERPFALGRVEILRAGKDCTIIAAGKMLKHAIEAADKLANREIECTVLNCHTIPVDKHAIITSARLTKCVVVADETGALMAPICETLSVNAPVPVKTAEGEAAHIMKAVSQAVMERCELSCAEMHEEHGKKLMPDLRPDLYFRLHNGGIVKHIPGLQKALLTMPTETFNHHTNGRNDFSSWVKDVFNEPTLAKHLEQARTQTGMALAIARWYK